MKMDSELDELTEGSHNVLQTLPEVPDDGVLIKTLYAAVCDATHSPQNKLDLTRFVGQFSSVDNKS